MRRGLVWLWAASLCLCAGCFSLDRDGDGLIDVPPPAGYETDELACSDGRDNDQDGRIDCMDEDCLMGGFCGEQVPNTEPAGYENTYELCSNGVDDDLDGQFDCGDRQCQAILELCCLSEYDDATCSNGIDDDGNGFTDCQDFSCRNGPFVTVCEEELDCTDRIDNDGDRRTDCNDDDCATHPACGENDCGDGVDNDGNGDIDCRDAACEGDAACPPETNCSDGVDENDDGLTDCADAGCRGQPECMGPENTADRCMDGISNDDDDFVDCADFDCDEFCEDEGTSLDSCMDGEDNDDNGFVDCNDFACSMSADAAIVAYCESIVENNMERCSDGIDNDGNGYVDCNDNNCQFSGDQAVRTMCESTFETCTDRRDNNDNGFVDCADFSCRYVQGIVTGGCSGTGGCPAGQACIRGICSMAISPCQEGVDPGGNYTPVGGMIGDELTHEERRLIVVAGCTDGIDNDADGFVDCEDFDCNYNPMARDAAGDPICRHALGPTCVAGPNAGSPCPAGDTDCGLEGACAPAGPEGTAFVCP